MCADVQERRNLSLAIHGRRKHEKKEWRQSLIDRASHGDWLARRCLQKKQGPTASVTQNLVRNFRFARSGGSHVREHFARRFAAPPEPPLSFDDLPVSESDFTDHEVHCAVQKMRPGKTTGMSKVSVELLRCLVALPFGLHCLATMLNSFLRNPQLANLELAAGWVILLPKTLWPEDAKSFLPIVCGEVFAKLAARLATCRVVSNWDVRTCCFGSVPGKGVPEALYVVKHAAQSAAGLGDNTVFVQLDLSQAFDSLFVNAVLAFLREHWVASSALSASLLRWILVHSHLRFQQGGSHSPTLFGRIVAARFAQLVDTWRVRGERPAFEAVLLAYMGLVVRRGFDFFVAHPRTSCSAHA